MQSQTISLLCHLSFHQVILLDLVEGFYGSKDHPASKISHLWDLWGCKLPVMADRLAKQLAGFLRKRRGDLTFQQFSRKTGISDSTLHRLELGEQNVTLKTLEHLCSRLKCKVSDIFGE
jgi:DNA-binding Xre family transcriptional regulator